MPRTSTHLHHLLLLTPLLVSVGCGWVETHRQQKVDRAERAAPEWVIHAKANHQMGVTAYGERLAAAPKRGPEERLDLKLILDFEPVAELFARDLTEDERKNMFDTVNKTWGLALSTLQYRVNQSAAAVIPPHVVCHDKWIGVAHREINDWYQRIITAQQAGDVYAMLRFEPITGGSLGAGTRGFRITAKWSSAYVREDFSDQCMIPAKGDRTHLDEMLARMLTHIHTKIRLDLPALEVKILFTPGFHWEWFKLNAANSGGSSWDFDD